MNMEIVRRAANEAGVEWHESFEGEGCVNMEILQRLAFAIAAEEREACAMVCEAQTETGAHKRCAAAIRARNQPMEAGDSILGEQQ